MNQIKTFDDFINIKTNNTYDLLNDIDCENKTLNKPICDFVGVINGNGYTIKNLIIEQDIWREEQPISFFYSICNSVIKDLNIKNIKFHGLDSIYSLNLGVLADVMENSVIENLNIEVESENEKIIPLCNQHYKCDIKNVTLICNGKEVKV